MAASQNHAGVIATSQLDFAGIRDLPNMLEVLPNMLCCAVQNFAYYALINAQC